MDYSRKIANRIEKLDIDLKKVEENVASIKDAYIYLSNISARIETSVTEAKNLLGNIKESIDAKTN